MTVAAALLLTVALQTASPLSDQGPPHEGLLRSYENIETVLCGSPERKSAMRELADRYSRRLRAVRDAVAVRYGAEAADRSYISIGSCRMTRWDEQRKRAVDRAVADFDRDLRLTEKEYGLRGRRKS